MRKFSKKIPTLSSAAMIIAMAVASPVFADENPAPADPSLQPVYAQFGEKAGIVAIVDDLMVNLVSDIRTRAFFADADQKHIKAELVDQFCVILGGPCTYDGKTMRESHKKLAINEADFNALVEDLQVAMNKHNVPFRAQNKLLEKLAPMHREVITRP